MSRFINSHHYISSDEIGILRECKECTSHDWYINFNKEGTDPEIYYYLDKSLLGLVVFAVTKDFCKGTVIDGAPLFCCKNRRAWERLRTWLITNKRFLTVNTIYKKDLFKGQKLPCGCRFYEKADEERLKQLEKKSKSTAVKTEDFKKSTILTDEEPF